MNDTEFDTSMNYFASLTTIEEQPTHTIEHWYDYCVTPQQLDDYSMLPCDVSREILNCAFGTYMDFDTLPEGQVVRSRYNKIVEYIEHRKKKVLQSYIPTYILPIQTRGVTKLRIQNLRYCIGLCYAIEGVRLPEILRRMDSLFLSPTLKTIVRREYAMIQGEFSPESILTIRDYKYIDEKHEAKLKAIKDKLATFI